MLNFEDFVVRLESLLGHYGLTAAAFADKIGIQRSGVSHLLSGRNRPSLDFILKIIAVFPEVDLYWLIKGEGNMLRQETLKPSVSMPASDAGKIIVLHPDGTFTEYRPR